MAQPNPRGNWMLDGKYYIREDENVAAQFVHVLQTLSTALIWTLLPCKLALSDTSDLFTWLLLLGACYKDHRAQEYCSSDGLHKRGCIKNSWCRTREDCMEV